MTTPPASSAQPTPTDGSDQEVTTEPSHLTRAESGAGDPDQTWRVLGLVNDWIKHAETKAAATLATAGVSAGVLYNLVKNVQNPGVLLDVTAVACALCLILGGLFAAWALRPRLWSKEEPTSNLYFHHIARKHPKRDKSADYSAALNALTMDHAALAGEIADQVWSNAHVAKSKFQSANIGLTFVLVGIVLLGATAGLIACKTW